MSRNLYCPACKTALECGGQQISGALSCPICGSAIQVEEDPGQVTQTVTTIPIHAQSTDATRDGQSSSDLIPVCAGRYEIESEIARGGMGIVLRATDPQMQRDLAVKIAIRRDGDSSDLNRRFLEEARITGKLQHPGVPPIHDLGELEDGRPFFAMKLIEGRTFRQILSEDFSDDDSTGLDVKSDQSSRLGSFLKVCETIAFAHSLDVIHRDLKPANIMVGRFGDVQVMDWGIAKTVGKSQASANSGGSSSAEVARQIEPDETHLDTSPHSNDSTNEGAEEFSLAEAIACQTQIGTVLGTLRYMPPEQARGEIDRLDARVDVFALGAILCEILTGAPPYTARNHRQLFELVANGHVQTALDRLSQSGADEALVKLASDCIAPNPDKRPNDGSEVARRVQAYQSSVESRLKQAEIDREAARVQVSEESKRRKVEEARAKAESAKSFAERRRRQVTVVLSLTLLVMITGSAATLIIYLRDQSNRRQEAARLEGEESARHKQILDDATAAQNRSLTGLRSLFARLERRDDANALMSDLARWELELRSVESDKDQAASLLSSAPNLAATELRVSVDTLAQEIEEARQLLSLATRLDEIRMRSAISDEGLIIPVATTNDDYLDTFRGFKLDFEQAELATLIDKIGSSRITFLLQAALDHWLLTHFENGEPDGPLAQRIVGVLRGVDDNELRNLMRDPTSDVQSVFSRFVSEDDQDQIAHAILILSQRMQFAGLDSRSLLRSALTQNPREFWLAFSLANALPDPNESFAYYRMALALRPNDAIVHYNLGTELYTAGEIESAILHLRESIEIDPDFVPGLTNLGVVLDAEGDKAEAIRLYQRAIELSPGEAKLHTNLGKALAESGERSASIEQYRISLELDPDYAPTHNNLANSLTELGEVTEAMEHFRRAIELEPNNDSAHNNYAVSLKHQGEFEKAEHHYRRAVEINPSSALARYNLAILLQQFGTAKKIREALVQLNEAVRIQPDYAEAHLNIGFCYRQLGEWERCLESLEKGHELGRQLQHWDYPSDVWIEECKAFVRIVTLEEPLLMKWQNGTATLDTEITEALPIDHAEPTGYRRAFDVELSGGQTYVVDATADFDTLLFFEDNAFQILAENDDVCPPTNLQSRLVFVAPNDDTYRIVAKGRKGDTGPLTLSIRKTQQVNDAQITKGALAATDPTLNDSGYFDAHEFELEANVPYVVDLTSGDMDVVLYLMSPAGDQYWAVNDDASATTTNARIDFTPHEAGNYTFLVTSNRPRSLGEYELSLREFSVEDGESTD